MSETVRGGVIGAGALGRHHARVWAEAKGATLVGVHDLDRARAEEVAARHGCRAFDDAASLLAAVDAVSIATPTVTHHAIARQAIEAGRDVLVETARPVRPSPSSTRPIAAWRRGTSSGASMSEHVHRVVRMSPRQRSIVRWKRLSRPFIGRLHAQRLAAAHGRRRRQQRAGGRGTGPLPIGACCAGTAMGHRRVAGP